MKLVIRHACCLVDVREGEAVKLVKTWLRDNVVDESIQRKSRAFINLHSAIFNKLLNLFPL